jgi:hypothetical protein
VPFAVDLRGAAVTSATAASPSIQGESAALPSSQGQIRADPVAVGGRALIIWTNGTATGSVSGAANSVTVRARGDQCAGAPQMTLTVDGRAVLSAAVPATAWTDYSAPVALATRAHQLGVSFANDYLDTTCDRKPLRRPGDAESVRSGADPNADTHPADGGLAGPRGRDDVAAGELGSG